MCDCDVYIHYCCIYTLLLYINKTLVFIPGIYMMEYIHVRRLFVIVEVLGFYTGDFWVLFFLKDFWVLYWGFLRFILSNSGGFRVFYWKFLGFILSTIIVIILYKLLNNSFYLKTYTVENSIRICCLL